jgi:hypothetical protein
MPCNHAPTTSTWLKGEISASCNTHTLQLLTTSVSTIQSTVSTSHLVVDQELLDQVWWGKVTWTHISYKEMVVGCTTHQRWASKSTMWSLYWIEQSHLSPTQSEHFLHHWQSLHQIYRAASMPHHLKGAPWLRHSHVCLLYATSCVSWFF